MMMAPIEARGKTPRSGPAILLHAILVEIFDLERFGEILAEVVRRSGLQRLAVAHHGFDGIGVVGAGESLGVGLSARESREWPLRCTAKSV